MILPLLMEQQLVPGSQRPIGDDPDWHWFSRVFVVRPAMGCANVATVAVDVVCGMEPR